MVSVAKRTVTRAIYRLVPPIFRIFQNSDGRPDCYSAKVIDEQRHSGAAGDGSAGKEHHAPSKCHLVKFICCTSKEDGQKFILVCIKHLYKSNTLLAITCNSIAGTEASRKQHFDATISEAYSVSVPFYGRVLLSFNVGKPTEKPWRLTRYDRFLETQPGGPPTLEKFAARLASTVTEHTRNYNADIQRCRCFVGATWEMERRAFAGIPGPEYNELTRQSNAPLCLEHREQWSDNEKICEEERGEIEWLKAELVTQTTQLIAMFGEHGPLTGHVCGEIDQLRAQMAMLKEQRRGGKGSEWMGRNRAGQH